MAEGAVETDDAEQHVLHHLKRHHKPEYDERQKMVVWLEDTKGSAAKMGIICFNDSLS